MPTQNAKFAPLNRLTFRENEYVMRQLTLPLTWPDQATFDNFLVCKNNETLFACLKNFAQNVGEKYVFLILDLVREKH